MAARGARHAWCDARELEMLGVLGTLGMLGMRGLLMLGIRGPGNAGDALPLYSALSALFKAPFALKSRPGQSHGTYDNEFLHELFDSCRDAENKNRVLSVRVKGCLSKSCLNMFKPLGRLPDSSCSGDPLRGAPECRPSSLGQNWARPNA